MRDWLVYAGVGGLSLGVGSASLFSISPTDWWLLLLVGVTLSVVALRQSKNYSTTVVTLLAVFLLASAAGVWRTHVYQASLTYPLAESIGAEITISGTVVAEPDVRATNTKLMVAYEGTTLLVTTDRFADVQYGQVVSVTGRVNKPESFTTDLGRTFNYPGYLEAKGITHEIRYAQVEVLAKAQGNPLVGTLLTTKNWLLQNIEALLPEPQAGLAQGLLLGVKRALGDELEQVFRSTGIIHIVVLSGYNIMLVVAFVLYILSFVFPWRGRLVLGLLAIIGFALMVGLSATVVRASIMAAIALVARSLGRTYAVIRALLLAGVIMLMINPYLLVYDTGFQLSFLATLGLILVSPLLTQVLGRVPTVVGVREFLVATLATQLFVLPILLYQIGEFSVVAVMVNVLVLPLVPVAMLSTFLMAVMYAVLPIVAVPLSWIAYASLTYIVNVPTLFAQLPFASFVVPAFPFWLVVVAYVCLGYGVYRVYAPKDELSGWVIEEESNLVVSDSSTPVFFK